jgi:hypothetical protein
MRYTIWGTVNDIFQERIGEPFIDHSYQIRIATFDNSCDAEEYIKKSRLKKVVKESFSADKVFKKKSLLANCVDARVVADENVKVPHNPEI